MISLAVIDNEHSAAGTDLTVVWGEENRGSTKPTVERHVQTDMRVKAAPVPISETARVAYRPK